MTAAAYPTSYRDLLTSFDGSGRYRPLDALVVPASRSAERLRSAAAIAHKTDAELLVLCSQNAEPAAVARLMAEEHVARHHVVHMPAGLPLPPPAFRTCPDQPGRVREQARAEPQTQPRAARRAHGRLADRPLPRRRHHARRRRPRVAAQYGLEAAAAVGLPDRRLAGQLRRRPRQPGERRQRRTCSWGRPRCWSTWSRRRSAISRRSTTRVRSSSSTPWRNARLSRYPGRARQLPYDPFREFDRGRDEEFGEVIVEGLHGLPARADHHAFPTGRALLARSSSRAAGLSSKGAG